MWIELLPTIAILCVVALFIRQHRGLLVVQFYALIVASYLNLFPALDFLFAEGHGMESFGRYQVLIILFFEAPMLLIMHWSSKTTAGPAKTPVVVAARLSPWLPIVLAGLLFTFWFVALEYDLIFRRVGHEALERSSAEVPGILLYLYRAAVETSFFVVMFLWLTLRRVPPRSRYYGRYQVLIAAYLATFLAFFAINSRMQFVLLLLCLACIRPQISGLRRDRVKLLRTATLVILVVLGLTLFRELYIEDNDRIAAVDAPGLFQAVVWLIAARLDSVVILYRLDDAGFSPWGFHLSGAIHVFNFYSSFFTDPATYAAIKESLVTSPSVEIINRLLPVSEVDFPKSMILDMLLSFGVLGLLLAALTLGSLIGVVQRQLLSFRNFRLSFMTSLFVLPMLLEFEKEFLGLAFAFLKWTPILVVAYLLRPRFKVGQATSQEGRLPLSGTPRAFPRNAPGPA